MAHIMVQLHQTLAEQFVLEIQVGIIRAVERVHIWANASEIFDGVHHISGGVN